MPLSCNGLHDYSLPYYERQPHTTLTRFPLTRLKKVQKCMSCGEVQEVIESSQGLQESRVSRYEFEEGAK